MGIYRTAVTRLSLLLGLTALALSQTQVNYPTQIKNGPSIVAGAASLQSYLNTLSSTGGNLTINGTYGIRGITSALTVPSNVSVVCTNGGTIKSTIAHGNVISFSGSNSSISGCTLIGSAGNPQIPTLSTQGNVITITGGASYINISGNLIQGCEFACVYMGIGSFLTVQGNIFSNEANTTGSNSSTATQTILAYEQITDSLIADNWDTMGTNDVGIQISPCVATTANSARNTISGNHVALKNRYGIVLYGNCAASTQTVTNTNILGNFVNNISSRQTNGGSGASNNNNGMGIYVVDSDFVNIGHNFVTNTLLNRVDLTLPTGAISVSDSYQVHTFFNVIDTSLFSGLWFSTAVRQDPAGLGSQSVGDIVKNTGTEGVHVTGSVGVPISNTHFTDLQVYNTGLTVANDGVDITAHAPYTTIEHSVIKTVMGNGIGVQDGTSPHLTVVDTEISGAAFRGILSLSESPVLDRNRIHGSGGSTYAGIHAVTSGTGNGGEISGNEIFSNFIGIESDGSFLDLNLFSNSVYSNGTNWNLTGTNFSAKGNANLPDHSFYSATVTTSATIINAGACVIEAQHQFTGAVGLPGSLPAIPSVVMPTSLPANWNYLIPQITQAGDTVEFKQCNPTAGNITPDAASIVLSIR